MSDVTEPAEVTEEFDLVSRYLHDWPPSSSVEATNAALYGLAFLVIIAAFLTMCTLCDFEMCRRRGRRKRELQRKHDMMRVLSRFSEDDLLRMREKEHRMSLVPTYDLRRSKRLRMPKVVPYHVTESPPPYMSIQEA